MDFDLDKDIVLTEKQKRIDSLLTEYRNRGFKDFDTWNMDKDELLEVLNKCLKENRSYEKNIWRYKIFQEHRLLKLMLCTTLCFRSMSL